MHRLACATLLLLAAAHADASSARLRALERDSHVDARLLVEQSEQRLRVATPDDKPARMWALCGIVLALSMLDDDLARQQDAALQGTALARDLGDVELQSRFMTMHGLAMHAKGQHDEARELLDGAVALAEESRLEPALAKALNAKATLLTSQGDDAQALRLLFRAHRIFDEQHDAPWTGLILLNIGSALLRVDLHKSVDYLRRALAAWGEDPAMRRRVADAHSLLGVAHRRLQDNPAAERHWRECLQLNAVLGHTKDAAMCELRLSWPLMDQGRLAEASALVEHAAPVFVRTGHQIWQFYGLQTRARLASRTGDPAQAQAALDAMRVLLPRMSMGRKASYHETAAEVHVQQGRYELALRNERARREVETQADMAANQRLSTELNLRFEVEQIERENETLRAAQRVHQADRRAMLLALALAAVLATSAGFAVASRQRRRRQLAEAANVAKSRLLAAASRELQQPVHSINENLARLAAMETPARVHALLADARRCAAAIEAMFHALLDLSLLHAAVQPVQVEPFALQPLLERVRLQFEPQAHAKGLLLKVCPSRAWARSDPQLVERIVQNFVANALRYTQRGRVLVGCRLAGRRVRLAVYDNGPGIPADRHEAIFDEFYQLPHTGDEGAKGLGLGLAIVRRLARRLDAPVVLRSRPGSGSMFAIDLPRAPAMSDSALPAAPRFGQLPAG